MDTSKKENENVKSNVVIPVTILVVVVSFIVIAVLLASSNFDFVDWLMNLHGG
jgi:hypothetical protein